MDTKKEILEFLKANKDFIGGAFCIDKIGLFGSFARDEATKKSDVDILIKFKHNAKNIYEIKTKLREFLSKSLKRDVDIANLKYLKQNAKKVILKEAVYV